MLLAYGLGSTSGGPSRIDLTAVSATELKSKGIELLPPGNEKASISRELAISVATDLRPGSRAADTVYAISFIDAKSGEELGYASQDRIPYTSPAP